MTHDLPRTIAIDMDGTLVHPGGYISEANRRALQRARSLGAQIVIATGRRHSYAMKVLSEASMRPHDIVLSSNGSVARTVAGELLFRQTMPLAVARQICAEVQEFRDALVLTFDVFHPATGDGRGALVLENLDEVHRSIQRWVEANAAYIERVQPIEDALSETHLPIQAMLCGTMERMVAAERHLAGVHGGTLELFRTEYPARDLCILDIMPHGISKGSGIAALLARAGLTTDTLMCLGDNWNDVPMLTMARWPVLMGNAPETLRTLARERGWPIACSHEDDAVAKAIHGALDTCLAG